MAAERRLLEKARHELVTFDLVDVLLPQRPSSLHAEPAAGTGNGFGDGAVGVVANQSRLFDGGGLGGVVVVVGHICGQQLQHVVWTLSPTMVTVSLLLLLLLPLWRRGDCSANDDWAWSA